MASRIAVRAGTRGYASAVGTSKAASVKLPVATSGLPGTYAGAAYQAALGKSEKTLNALADDLNAVQGAIAKDPKLVNFLGNPTLSKKDQQAGIADMLKVAKSGADGITKNVFTVLAENGRLGLSERVISEFQKIMAAHRGEVVITITSAQPLDSSSQSRLERTLKDSAAAKAGKSVKFVNKVNPAVQGGLEIDFGDKSIDLTVASRVQRLDTMLKQAV